MTRLFFLLILFTCNSSLISTRVKGSDSNTSSASLPFNTICAAVKVAFPGDTITVHAGTYREWVNPLRGGESDTKRIIYRAAPGEKAEIKGSEVITGWKKEKDGTSIVFDKDYFENERSSEKVVAGPFVNLTSGRSVLKVW
jgi:hypothetical protein